MKDANEPAVKPSPSPGEQQFKDETARVLLGFFLQLSAKQTVATARGGNIAFDYGQAAIGSYMAAEALWRVRAAILAGQIKFTDDPKSDVPGTILPI